MKIQDTTGASLIFFGIEHTGCLGPEAMELGKAMANLRAEGPEGLKEISIGFETNRAIGISEMMGEVLNNGLGLGTMVTGTDLREGT
jgi:hypothetical protein